MNVRYSLTTKGRTTRGIAYGIGMAVGELYEALEKR